MIHFITSIRIIPATPIAIHSLLSTSKSWGQNVEIKPSENQRDLLDLLSPTVRWVSLIQNPRIFSLGFPFKPRLIAGRVGFRVSDGVSGGWSQRNLNCVFWSWEDLPGGGKNRQSGQGAILLTERMNVRPTWSTRLWTSSLLEVCRSRDDHWMLEVAPSSDIGCQSVFARKLCICQNELFYSYLQSPLSGQSKEWIKIQLSPYPHDILGSQLIPFERRWKRDWKWNEDRRPAHDQNLPQYPEKRWMHRVKLPMKDSEVTHPQMTQMIPLDIHGQYDWSSNINYINPNVIVISYICLASHKMGNIYHLAKHI